MNLRKITIFLLAAAALPASLFAAGRCVGVVIYKEFAFDPDSQAEIADYSGLQRLGSVDNVITPDGQTLRIFSNQGPIYIPGPGTAGSDPGDVTRAIRAAESRFPQFARRLEIYRQGWALAAQAAPAPRSTPAVAAAPPALASDPSSATPAAGSGKVLRTQSGETFQGWSVSGMEGDTVVITHADGVSRVPIADLPDNLYGFPPEVIARAELLRQQAAAQARADLEKAAGFPTASPTAHGKHRDRDRDKDLNGDRPSD
jgi:hypothetical protein